MSFDNALAVVGGFGKFQLWLIFLTIPGRATLPLNYLLNNFIAAVPSHHCNIDSLDDGGVFRNLSQDDKLRVGIPVRQDGTRDSCVMFAKPQYHLLLQNSSNATNLPTVPCQQGWVYDNSTFSHTVVTQWDLVCDKRQLSRTSATVFFIGVMSGAFLFGYLSDSFGRKKALLLSYLTVGIFGLISAFSNSFVMFGAMRFITGMGLSGVAIVTIGLIVEWVDISHRMGAIILVSLDWSVFVSVLSVLAYFITDWRSLTVAVISPMFLAIVCWWWIPESARWLIANGEVNKAHYYLSQCARVNGREQGVDDLKPEALSKVIVVENKDRKYSYLDLVRTPKIRRLALLSGLIWFGIASPYYGISLSISGLGVSIYLSQFIYGVIEIPGKLFVFLTLDRIGRRPIQSLGAAVTSLCLLCNMFIPKGLFQAGVGALGKMFSEAAFTVLYLYTSEIYPTVIRQNGLGYCSVMARIGVSVTTLVFLLEEVWSHFPSIIFFFIAFAASLLTLLLPETKNIRLPETIEEVEQTRRRSTLASEEKEMSYSELKTEVSDSNE